jgi:hypothetical protein
MAELKNEMKSRRSLKINFGYVNTYPTSGVCAPLSKILQVCFSRQRRQKLDCLDYNPMRD